MWLGNSVVRVLAGYARGPGFESLGLCDFFFPVILDGSVWVHARAASSKGTVSLVPSRYEDESS